MEGNKQNNAGDQNDLYRRKDDDYADTEDDDDNDVRNSDNEASGPRCDAIDCVINGQENVACRRQSSEIYIPFSFVRDYFEVYGKVAKHDGYILSRKQKS